LNCSGDGGFELKNRLEKICVLGNFVADLEEKEIFFY